MSKAFQKDDEARWLHEIAPSMRTLVAFLTNENGRIIVEKRSYYDEETKTEYHVMSDGLTYFINESGNWDTLPE